MSEFAVGRQPCKDFKPVDDLVTGGGNVHCCAWPFKGKDWCYETHGGLVSFCANCNRDHHSGGYETCAAEVAKMARIGGDE